MHLQPHTPTDIAVLKTKAHGEKNAKQRDRYRAVTLALDGHQTKEIMRMLGRSRNFVQRWNYAYRDGGIEALIPRVQSGRPTKLPRGKESQFKQRILAGPSSNDNGICTLRAKDAKVILEKDLASSTVFSVSMIFCTDWAFHVSNPGPGIIKTIRLRWSNGLKTPPFCPRNPAG